MKGRGRRGGTRDKFSKGMEMTWPRTRAFKRSISSLPNRLSFCRGSGNEIRVKYSESCLGVNSVVLSLISGTLTLGEATEAHSTLLAILVVFSTVYPVFASTKENLIIRIVLMRSQGGVPGSVSDITYACLSFALHEHRSLKLPSRRASTYAWHT